jgi:1,4-dihydroxy-2-naphthoate octaprenyltransferase
MQSIVQHLRFPFSFLLMPIFMFALSEVEKPIAGQHAVQITLLFLLLHLLVYPSSNAYNSLQDKDKGSIGLIKHPMEPSPHLAWITAVMDGLAILLSLGVSWEVGVSVLLYIVASRLYSYRGIRLKKYPVIGFLVIFLFQGVLIYFTVQIGAGIPWQEVSLWNALVSGCLVGAIYPLSQIYQHQQDKADGVTTLSYILGYKGTFYFTGVLFFAGTVMFLYEHMVHQEWRTIILYTTFQLPVITFFTYWFFQVRNSVHHASFTNSMRMNILAAASMLILFWILFLLPLKSLNTL